MLTLEKVLSALDGVKERYEREKNQAILKESMPDARWALAAQEACDRIARGLRLFFEVRPVLLEKPRGAQMNLLASCSLCGRSLVDSVFSESLCRDCRLDEKFRVCAELVAVEIKREENLLLRLQLLKRFFGVAVNEWERQKLFPVPSAENK